MILTVSQWKGGVGKTLVARELSVLLAQAGQRVLVVDADKQGDLTRQIGARPEPGAPSLANVLGLTPAVDAADAIIATGHGPDLIPGSTDLASVEMALVSQYGREAVMHDALSDLSDAYDVIVIDTPPNLGLLAVNGLVAADVILAPVNVEDEGAANGMLQFTRTLTDLERLRQGRPAPKLLSVLTKTDDRRIASDILTEAMAERGVPIVARIPARAAFHNAAIERTPLSILDPRSDAVAALTALAHHIIGAPTT